MDMFLPIFLETIGNIIPINFKIIIIMETYKRATFSRFDTMKKGEKGG